jgi:hypothetical protein
MTISAVPPIRQAEGQATYVELGLPDLKFLARELRTAPIEELKRADDLQGALRILFEHFGFVAEAITAVTIATPIGDVTVQRDKLVHIVEKRPDSRERYVKHAIDTLSGPFEVWKVRYDHGGYRLAFINAYEAKNDMLVIVEIRDGHTLWNFMHAPSKSMNRHRQGELIYKRYVIEGKEKGQL